MTTVVFLGGVSHLKLLMTNSFCILQKAINFPVPENFTPGQLSTISLPSLMLKSLNHMKLKG
jgi:hypothetical protein